VAITPDHASIATIHRREFRFHAARHWADEQNQWRTPKRNVHFLIVTNQAGLQQYVQQDQVNREFAYAHASQPGNPPQRPKQLKMTIQQTVSPPGLYPPKHYSKAPHNPATAWSPADQQTNKEFSKIFHKTELKFRPGRDHIHGWKQERGPHVGLVTGSGVYRDQKRAHLSLEVHPYGQGMLNTTNRAELAALLIALRHCRPGVTESIATDSKCSMQKIGTHLRSPSSTVGDYYWKRNGNEMADKLANEAADECCMGRKFDDDLSNDYTYTHSGQDSGLGYYIFAYRRKCRCFMPRSA